VKISKWPSPFDRAFAGDLAPWHASGPLRQLAACWQNGFLHFKGTGTAPQPLLLTNGWPLRFMEHTRLAPLLSVSSIRPAQL
jgi:hypothetical protein